MLRLVFIDDDQTELTTFQNIVVGEYEYLPVHWPRELAKLHMDRSPDLIVSDLYLPGRTGDQVPTTEQLDKIKSGTLTVADQFSTLSSDLALDAKARLQATMKAISGAYKMLELQWKALGQSPENGIALLHQLKSRFPDVPFVFYSRKVTPEDVIHVQREGADDVIRKSGLSDDQVLARFAEVLTAKRTRERRADEALTTQPDARVPAQTKSIFKIVKGWAEGANTWFEVGSGAFGLITAFFAFLLAKGKLFEFLHEPKSPASEGMKGSFGVDALAILAAWYLVTWLLFVMGGVAHSVFTELWKLIFKLIRLRWPSKATSGQGPALEQTVPRLFRLAWDVCVIIAAVLPALGYTIRLVSK